MEEGITPMQVMISNMRFWHESAETVTRRLADVAATVTGKDLVEGSDNVKQLFKLLEDVGAFREKSQGCARDAAPYMHPRLAAIAIKRGNGGLPPPEIKELMSPKEAADIYSQSLMPQDDEVVA